MLKKIVTFALCCLLLAAVNSSVVTAQTVNDASKTAKIKTKIVERGTGEKKRVTVKMLTGAKLKGFVSQTSDDSFTLTDSSTKQNTVIAYSDVAKVENRSTKGDKIALYIIGGAAAAAAIILIGFISIRCKNEGGC